MAPPAGTFLAQVRKGALQFPSAIRSWCDKAGWNLFQVIVIGPDCLELRPVSHTDSSEMTGPYQASFDPDGSIWIPTDVRERVSLGEQSVMIRVENGAIRVFLRKVFETLGFRP